MQFQNAEFIASYGTFSQIPPCDSVEIAFAGRSNVGKSTLINKIFQRKSLARVSAVPGKTATINFYRLRPLTIVDLPGYGYAKVAKSEKARWSGLISGYLGADRDLRLILLLIDMRHAPSKDDIQMIDFLVESELPFLIVLTKADKLNKTERAKRMQAFWNKNPVFFPDSRDSVLCNHQRRRQRSPGSAGGNCIRNRRDRMTLFLCLN